MGFDYAIDADVKLEMNVYIYIWINAFVPLEMCRQL